MSGSGGSGYGGGFNDGGAACELLVIHTQLSSPVAAVVQQLAVGDVMQVVSQPGPVVALVQAMYRGQIAGGIAAAQISRLLECLSQGHAYKATVTAIQGGQVKIRVEVA